MTRKSLEMGNESNRVFFKLDHEFDKPSSLSSSFLSSRFAFCHSRMIRLEAPSLFPVKRKGIRIS